MNALVLVIAVQMDNVKTAHAKIVLVVTAIVK